MLALAIDFSMVAKDIEHYDAAEFVGILQSDPEYLQATVAVIEFVQGRLIADLGGTGLINKQSTEEALP